MARGARPSDVYRLPEHARAAEDSRTPPPDDPRRRFPAWLGVALVLALVLVVSGVLGTSAAPVPGQAPLVDIVSEDQAIAALALYGAEASAITQLRQREDIFANPGPGDAARVANNGAAETQQALEAARKVVNPDPLMAAYVQHGDHSTTIRYFTDARTVADTIALFTSTHATLFDGTGSIPLDEAYTRISSEVSGGSRPAPLDDWGHALLDIIEERGGQQAALQGRADSQRLWAQLVTSAQPAGVTELVTYIDGLPAVTVDGLRGHPVAGPALRQLVEQSRQISQ